MQKYKNLRNNKNKLFNNLQLFERVIFPVEKD